MQAGAKPVGNGFCNGAAQTEIKQAEIADHDPGQ